VILFKDGEIIKKTYRIIRKLGEGGEGSVFLVAHERTYALRAMKVISAKRGAGIAKEVVNRLQLTHTGLPSVLDIWQEDNQWFFVMEYISGKTLEDLRKKSLDYLTIMNWTEQLCDILSYLHHCNPPLIYGDLKPENIICRENGAVVLTDFGSMRRADSKNPIITGTREYAAPEQYHQETQLDNRTDIYSLGLCMKAVLGRQSKKRSTSMERTFDKILNKCIQTKQSDRYSSCEALGLAIQRAKRRRPYVILGTLSISILLIALAVAGARREQMQAVERQYQQYLISDELSKIKSAIILNPYREEAYHKLLEKMIQDTVLDVEEELFLRQVVADYGIYLRHDEREYARFSYQAGIAYWYYFVSPNNKKQAIAWFEQAELTGTLSIEQRRYCEVFGRLGQLYAVLEHGDTMPKTTMDMQVVWKHCQELLAWQEGGASFRLQVWNEVMGICYRQLSEFLEKGITAQEIRQSIEQCQAEIAKITESTGEIKEQKKALAEKHQIIEQELEVRDR